MLKIPLGVNFPLDRGKTTHTNPKEKKNHSLHSWENGIWNMKWKSGKKNPQIFSHNYYLPLQSSLTNTMSLGKHSHEPTVGTLNIYLLPADSRAIFRPQSFPDPAGTGGQAAHTRHCLPISNQRQLNLRSKSSSIGGEAKAFLNFWARQKSTRTHSVGIKCSVFERETAISKLRPLSPRNYGHYAHNPAGSQYGHLPARFQLPEGHATLDKVLELSPPKPASNGCHRVPRLCT